MKKLIEKVRISILPIFAGIFTFLGFGTAEIFISNRTEFWFEYADVLPILIILALVVFFLGVLMVVLLPERCYKYVVAGLYGFALAIYVQGNFLPNDYGELNGEAIDWGQYQVRFVINTIIWCAIVLGHVLLYRKYKEKIWSGFKLITGIVFGTQIITLVTICLMMPVQEETTSALLSTDGQFDISTGNNTFVFVLDSFDAQYFYELHEKYSTDFEENFTDFVFYRDTVGGATRTKYAIPFMLTGQAKTKNNSYADYLRESASTSELFTELKTSNYDARLYTTSEYIDVEQVKAIDNIETGKTEPSSVWGLTKDFVKLTAFRYAPHAFKKMFWIYSDDINTWKGSSGNAEAYILDDVKFYEALNEGGVKRSLEQDVLRLYHLVGTHAPYVMDENCENVAVEVGTKEGQALGTLKIVNSFMQKLRELGAYDNATIIIMADHGDRGHEQNPLFMIKRSGIKHEFVQSDVPLSYKDFSDMLVDVLKDGEIDVEGKYADYGARYFYTRDADDVIHEWVSEDKAYLVDGFKTTGNTCLGYEERISYEYQVGETLSFAQEATANGYCVSGFSVNEGMLTWTLGTTAEMYFELKGKYNDLMLEFECGVIKAPQNVKVYVNDVEIVELAVDGDGKEIVRIPKEYIEEGALKLRFELLNAVSPYELGHGGDKRTLSLSMRSLVIRTADK